MQGSLDWIEKAGDTSPLPAEEVGKENCCRPGLEVGAGDLAVNESVVAPASIEPTV